MGWGAHRVEKLLRAVVPSEQFVSLEGKSILCFHGGKQGPHLARQYI